MTIEYVLILVFVVAFSFTKMIKVPSDAFKASAPRLASRVEKQLITGDGFSEKAKEQWTSVKETPF